MPTCRSCKYMRGRSTVQTEQGPIENGFCYRYPPKMLESGGITYIPVAVLRFWCGEWRLSLRWLFKALRGGA